MSRTTQQGVVGALLEAKYDTTLKTFLIDSRSQELSYNRIARDLHDLTDGDVSVTGETIRRWINDLEVSA
jgi:hypothetical protein